LPLSSVLVDQPATEPLLQISPSDSQDRLGSKEPHNRAAPREPISDFITSYSGMARDPKEEHSGSATRTSTWEAHMLLQ